MTIVKNNSIVLDFTTKGKEAYKESQSPIDLVWGDLGADNAAIDDFIALRIPEQAYFWTKEWQEAEAEATDDIRNGRTTRFSNVKDAIKYLQSRQV